MSQVEKPKYGVLFYIEIAKPKKNYWRGLLHSKQVTRLKKGEYKYDLVKCTDENGKELTFMYPVTQESTYDDLAFEITSLNGYDIDSKVIFFNNHILNNLFKHKLSLRGYNPRILDVIPMDKMPRYISGKDYDVLRPPRPRSEPKQTESKSEQKLQSQATRAKYDNFENYNESDSIITMSKDGIIDMNSTEHKCRRLLRYFNQITIIGIEEPMKDPHALIRKLEKEKMCKIKSITPDINENGDTIIEIIIERGKYGKCLSGIEKEKVIQLFQNEINKMVHANDEMKSNENNDYRLNNRKDKFEMNVEKVKQLNLCQAFGRSEIAADKIDKILSEESHKNDGFVNVPMFIRYLSMIVKPRFKYEVFCEVLKSLGVEQGDKLKA